MPDVYVVMCADVVHRGHINLLQTAATYGRVIVGLLGDAAMADYKRVPLMPYHERAAVIGSIRWVDQVVRQDLPSPVPYIEALRPDIFLHGDDWRTGPATYYRDRVIEALNGYGGRLIEIPYTEGVSSTGLQARLQDGQKSTAASAMRLRRLLALKRLVRAAGISGPAGQPPPDAAWFTISPHPAGIDLNALYRAVEAFAGPVVADCRALVPGTAVPDVLRRLVRIGAAGVCLAAPALLNRPEVWDDMQRSGSGDLVTAVYLPAAGLDTTAPGLPHLVAEADIVLVAADADGTPVLPAGVAADRCAGRLGLLLAGQDAAAEDRLRSCGVRLVVDDTAGRPDPTRRTAVDQADPVA